MSILLGIVNFVRVNLADLSAAVAYLVLFGSIVVKLTPTLKDDNRWLPFVKWIGKYLALDKYGKKGA